MSQIKASRNGITRQFDVDYWNSLPADKYGWVAAAEVPEEVKGDGKQKGAKNAKSEK